MTPTSLGSSLISEYQFSFKCQNKPVVVQIIQNSTAMYICVFEDFFFAFQFCQTVIVFHRVHFKWNRLLAFPTGFNCDKINRPFLLLTQTNPVLVFFFLFLLKPILYSS
jgi:hypothetical protein